MASIAFLTALARQPMPQLLLTLTTVFSHLTAVIVNFLDRTHLLLVFARHPELQGQFNEHLVQDLVARLASRETAVFSVESLSPSRRAKDKRAEGARSPKATRRRSRGSAGSINVVQKSPTKDKGPAKDKGGLKEKGTGKRQTRRSGQKFLTSD